MPTWSPSIELGVASEVKEVLLDLLQLWSRVLGERQVTLIELAKGKHSHVTSGLGISLRAQSKFIGIGCEAEAIIAEYTDPELEAFARHKRAWYRSEGAEQTYWYRVRKAVRRRLIGTRRSEHMDE